MLRKKSRLDSFVVMVVGIVLLIMACAYAFSEIDVPTGVYFVVWGICMWQIFKRTDLSSV